jgi:formamidopyrimidine-DNA glycosylase
MPELPEVESLRRGLKKYVLGQKIKKVWVGKPKLVSGRGNIRKASAKKVAEFIKSLRGETIQGIERQAKNLIFVFRSGKVLVVHLKMSGQLVYRNKNKKNESTYTVMGGHPIELSEKELPNKHTHVIFELTRGTLFYNDPRMFGYLLLYPTRASAAAHFEKYGLDPLSKDFTLEKFTAGLKKKKGRLKTVLMGQEVVTGLGNIYADESCFMARISPLRSTQSLKPKELRGLFAAIKKILPRAIALGGSSVATYRLLDGTRGNYAHELRVYGRGGKKCLRCGHILKEIQLNNRTTVYCPNCQK